MTTVERPGAGTDATDKSFPWAFFILAYGFTWLICLPGVLAARRLIALPIPTTALIAVAQFGPTLAAFLLVARAEGRAGAKRLLGRALAWRIPARWLVPTLLLPPALAGLALALGLAGGAPRPDLPLLAQPLAILPSFVFIFLLQGPVPEEFGWRGYALDRLQRRWGALGASLVLGALWATWHLPLFLMGGFHSFVPPWAFFVRVVADAIVLTWLYNNTGGNLLVALLYHTTTNLAVALFPPIAPVTGGDQRVFLILTALHALVAAAVVARWGATTLTRRRPARAWPALAAARN